MSLTKQTSVEEPIMPAEANAAPTAQCMPPGLSGFLSEPERLASALPSRVVMASPGWVAVYQEGGGARAGGKTYYWNPDPSAQCHGCLLALGTDEHCFWEAYFVSQKTVKLGSMWFLAPLRSALSEVWCEHSLSCK